MHKVKCIFCQKSFDRDKLPFVQVQTRRYAHKECYAQEGERLQKEEQDRLNLENYINQLFNSDFVSPRIQKQIKQFREDYNYTYSGIHKALIYFFEIKHNSLDKANNGIGIVPYVYQQAHTYYYTLWLAQQQNENKEIQEYVPTDKLITISAPQRKIRKRKVFTFLDEEETE